MKKFSLLILCGALAFASCSEKTSEPVEPTSTSYTFTSEIDGVLVKATDVSFEAGDQIAVSAYESDSYETLFAGSACYTYSGSVFDSESPISIAESGVAAFRAVYPYQSNIDSEFTFSVEQNQNSQSAYTLSDLMVAETVTTAATEVKLSFARLLSQIKVILKDDSGSAITDAEVFVSALSSLDVNVPMAEYTAKGDATDIQALNNGDGTYSVIVPSQTLAASTQLVKIVSGGTTSTDEVTEDFTLQSGYTYSFYVTVAD